MYDKKTLHEIIQRTLSEFNSYARKETFHWVTFDLTDFMISLLT